MLRTIHFRTGYGSNPNILKPLLGAKNLRKMCLFTGGDHCRSPLLAKLASNLVAEAKTALGDRVVAQYFPRYVHHCESS